MAYRSTSWWLHVWCLVILQHMWIISNQPAPNNETHWDNFTTGLGQVYVTGDATIETLNATNNETSSNFTIRPEQDFITSDETPDTSLEMFPSNVTAALHVTNISQDTNGRPNSTPESLLNHTPTGADLSYISQETTRSPNITLQSHPENVTSGPHLTYMIEETSEIPNSTLETFPNNVTTGPHLTYVTEETSRGPNRSPENYPSNVTTGPHLTYITEETSSAPNRSPENYPSNVTTGPHSTSTTQYTSGTSTSTLEPYPNNATTRPNMSYDSEETSRTPSTTTEKYQSNVTSGAHLTYITEETSRTSNTTLFVPNNGTTAGDLIYTNEEPSRTINNIQEFFFNVTSGLDLTSLMVVTVRTPNSTLEQLQSNVTTDPGLVYLSEKTTGTPNTSLEMDRTSYPDIINSLDPIDTITDAPTTWTPITSVQTGGTFFISAVHCFQDADCPPYSMCSLQGALHICQCHLGHFFHQDLGCVAARTFPARIPISVLYWDETLVNTSVGGDAAYEIRHMEAAQYDLGVHRVRMLFQDVLCHIPGYVSTSITDVQLDEGHVTIVHSFSTLYPVTEEDVWRALMVSPIFCDDPHDGCASALTRDNYQGLSLCDFDVCDFSSSDCHVHGGLVTCECRRGYYKFSPTDRSCRECGSGYRRTESGCERCPIGFGGFNCDESYLLAVIVESCVGCGLLVSLITLLVFYFRRKKPQKPMLMDSIVFGVPTIQPSIRLPRAQFSWRREWEWNEPPEKVQTDIDQEAASPEGSAIHMKTFGDPARFSAPSSHHGRHNLSFISD